MVVEDFSWGLPKTTEWMKVLDKLQVADKKTLFVISDYNKSLYLSSRNLKGSKIVNVADLSTYDLMNAKQIVFVQSSLLKLEDNLNG